MSNGARYACRVLLPLVMLAAIGYFAAPVQAGISFNITTNSPLTNGQVGLSYFKTFSHDGSSFPVTNVWSITAGSLPPGITINSSGFGGGGSLSGTPTTAGTYNFSVQGQHWTPNETSYVKAFQLTIDAVETVSPNPNAPSGPAARDINQSGSYTIGGSTSSLGHTVKYRIDWNDGTFSTWVISASSHSWSSTGTFNILAEGRCGTHTTRTTAGWGPTFAVVVTKPPASAPNMYASDGTYSDKVRITVNPYVFNTENQFWRSAQGAGSPTDLLLDWNAATYFDDTGGTPGVTYKYWVRTRNDVPDQTASAYSTDDGYRAVAAPTGLTSQSSGGGPNKINWKWTDNSSNEDGFYVADTSSVTKVTAAANATTGLESSLSENTSYTRKVKAYYTAGTDSAWSTTAARYSGVRNATTGDFSLTVLGDTSIRITCTAPTNSTLGSTGVQIERSPNGSSSWTTVKAYSSTYTYDNTGLTSNTTYYYRITYRNYHAYASSTSGNLNATTTGSSNAVSGNIYSDDDTTLSAGSGTIRVFDCVASSELANAASSTSSFSLTVTPPADGTLIAVYLDTTTAADRAMTVFTWQGGSVDQTTLHLRKGYVRFNQNGSATPFTYSMNGFLNLDAGTGATNIVSSATASVLTTAGTIGVQVVASAKLTIPGGAGTLTTAGDVYISGTLELSTNSKLRMSTDAATITVAGTLNTRGTDSSAASSSGTVESVTAGNVWKILVNDSGSLNARGGRFIDGWIDAAGASPSQILCTDCTFTSLPDIAATADDVFINLAGITSGEITLRNLTITRGSNVAAASARNILADTSTRTVYVVGYDGNLSGETFDTDTYNKVRWISNRIQIQYVTDGGAASYADSLAEALENIGGTTFVVSANYDNSGSDPVSAYALHVGTLTIDSTFTGTVVLDGITLMTDSAANPTLISGGNAAGTVNLYNCMLLDPNDPTTDADLQGTRTLVSATATVNAYFSTIDGLTTGITTVSNSLHRNVAGGFDAGDAGAAEDWFISYSSRNLRLTSNLDGTNSLMVQTQSGWTAAKDATYDRDIDGRVRKATTEYGAFDFQASAAAYTSITDFASTLATDASAVFVAGMPRYSSKGSTGGGVYYISGADGAKCYVSVITAWDATVATSVSWTGSGAAGYVNYIQTSDDSSKYWLLVSYDYDGDGYYDRIRKVLHTKGATGGTLTDSGDVGGVDGVLYHSNVSTPTEIDFTASGGWSGTLSIQSMYSTGASERQIALTTQTGGGEIHIFYVNVASTSGQFYGNSDLAAKENYAAESYVSSVSLNLNASPSAPVSIFGGGTAGTLTVVRVSDASSTAGVIRFSRDAITAPTADKQVTSGAVTAFLTGFTSGESLATQLRKLQRAKSFRMVPYDSNDQVITFQANTLADSSTVDVGLGVDGSGWGSPAGVDPVGYNKGGMMFVPFYNDGSGTDTAQAGMGAVAAIEYKRFQNGGTVYEVLDGSYSDTKIRYHVATAGGFSNGVAKVVGKPTAMLLYLSTQTVYCATDAGMLYAWESNTRLSSEDTTAKGSLISGFPLRVPGGKITTLAYMPLTDSALLAKVGLTYAGSSINVLAAYTDAGECLLISKR